jgi:hypothetical protein
VVIVAEKKKFGPYKGSKANGGRPIYVYKEKVDGKWVTTSKNKARADYESEHGKIKSKKKTVDHKNNNHSDDRKGNLQLMDKGKNTAKENKRRAGKK